MDNRKFICQRLEPKDYTHEDSYCEYKTWYVIHTDYGGYTENELNISLLINGELSCWSDREGFGCYLYKEQVELLTHILIDFNNIKENK